MNYYDDQITGSSQTIANFFRDNPLETQVSYDTLSTGQLKIHVTIPKKSWQRLPSSLLKYFRNNNVDLVVRLAYTNPHTRPQGHGNFPGNLNNATALVLSRSIAEQGIPYDQSTNPTISGTIPSMPIPSCHTRFIVTPKDETHVQLYPAEVPSTPIGRGLCWHQNFASRDMIGYQPVGCLLGVYNLFDNLDYGMSSEPFNMTYTSVNKDSIVQGGEVIEPNVTGDFSFGSGSEIITESPYTYVFPTKIHTFASWRERQKDWAKTKYEGLEQPGSLKKKTFTTYRFSVMVTFEFILTTNNQPGHLAYQMSESASGEGDYKTNEGTKINNETKN